MNELTPKQEKFLLARLSNGTVEEASEQAGVSIATGYRYMKDEKIKEAHRQLVRRTMQTVTGRLQYESLKAVNVLSEIMDDEEAPYYSRVEASKTILDMAYKGYELEDVLQRVEKLEDFQEELKNE